MKGVSKKPRSSLCQTSCVSMNTIQSRRGPEARQGHDYLQTLYSAVLLAISSNGSGPMRLKGPHADCGLSGTLKPAAFGTLF